MKAKRRVEPREIKPGLDLPVDFFPTEYRDAFGARTSSFNEDLYFGKINFTPTANDLFEFSVKYRDESGEELNNGINAAETATITKVKEWRGLARWEHTADTWVNDFKVAYEDVTWNPRPLNFGNVSLFNAILPPIPPATAPRRGDILRIGAGVQLPGQGPEGLAGFERFHLDRPRKPHVQGGREGEMGRTQRQHAKPESALHI